LDANGEVLVARPSYSPRHWPDLDVFRSSMVRALNATDMFIFVQYMLVTRVSCEDYERSHTTTAAAPEAAQGVIRFRLLPLVAAGMLAVALTVVVLSDTPDIVPEPAVVIWSELAIVTVGRFTLYVTVETEVIVTDPVEDEEDRVEDKEDEGVTKVLSVEKESVLALPLAYGGKVRLLLKCNTQYRWRRRRK
jgi:hypothetical protein